MIVTNAIKIWGITEIYEHLGKKIKQDNVLQNMFVKGEVSNFYKQPGTGHMYFSLKEGDSVISAVMFAKSAQKAGIKFIPYDGLSIIAKVSVGIYQQQGKCQLVVWDMQPDGAGADALALEQLRERLTKEGIFSEENKKPIPGMPETIGLVAGANSKAEGDVKKILSERYPLATLYFFPAIVQGENAPASICSALERADSKGLDVIILGRGGGSQEDLGAFNVESVVRKVFACRTPIISAVGHEANYSLSDYAADERASTPSNAVEKAVPDKNFLSGQLSEMERALRNSFIARFNSKVYALNMLSQRIETASPVNRIKLSGENLKKYEEILNSLYREKLRSAENIISSGAERLREEYERYINRKDAKIAENIARIESLSPLKTLSRGYSLVYKEDRLISSAKELSAGDSIKIRLSDGEVSASVK